MVAAKSSLKESRRAKLRVGLQIIHAKVEKVPTGRGMLVRRQKQALSQWSDCFVRQYFVLLRRLPVVNKRQAGYPNHNDGENSLFLPSLFVNGNLTRKS